MNRKAIKEALSLLDTHYDYVVEGRGGETQKSYYEGMVTMLDYVISAGCTAPFTTGRKENGDHYIAIDVNALPVFATEYEAHLYRELHGIVAKIVKDGDGFRLDVPRDNEYIPNPNPRPLF